MKNLKSKLLLACFSFCFTLWANDPGLILYNSLDEYSSFSDSGNELDHYGSSSDFTFGPSVINSGLEITASSTDAPRIPLNTLPRNEYTISFFYTRTTAIPIRLELLSGNAANGSYPDRGLSGYGNDYLRLGIHTTPTYNSDTYHIRFDERATGVNDDAKMFTTTEISSLADLENLFPLGQPVHVAISRDSDGYSKLFIDGATIKGTSKNYPISIYS